ncbi:MAG TPA: MBL fold metallo-hydrolase [Pseudomonadales bacterium]|jgi:glyoxylase-like metal-dependent hydrolase (beta-lactamase superfamily II)|nr:MBL fold metallo-hydrolase [Pseudomonadales bacterium]HNI37520.1 MBL fold metallo-hydrolase [Pseudomonadales bacterium]HNL91572.1 MBL fold metallo-hydrolase [Pseudomonadales bacterium]
MLFRQLFDHDSWTYSYLLADEKTREALIIDSVDMQVDNTVQLLEELNLKLVLSIETHTHADHITGAGLLRERTGCLTRVGEQSSAHCAGGTYRDGDILTVGSLRVQVWYTPGHTDDSYSFLLLDDEQPMVFTGDTLLIRGCGRTDFQNGNAGQQYDSLQRLLTLPPHTRVYPAHDYRGWAVSSIDEEAQHNPRIRLPSRDAFITHMNNLKLPNPKLMDVAVPANRLCGKAVG